MRPGPDWFIWIEALGILSFAINALIVANGKGLSTLGFFVCAAATALGGGTVRDILLGPQAQPFFWIAHPFYIVAIFIAAVAYANLTMVRVLIAKRDFLIKETAEAIALASLAAIGGAKAFSILSGVVGASSLALLQLWILCAVLGAVGVAFGSVLRDVLLNEFPSSLKRGYWVVESAFLGAGVVAAARLAEVAQPWAILAGFLAALTMRLGFVFTARRRTAMSASA